MIDCEGVGTFYKHGVELFKSESAAKVCSCLVMAIVIFNLLNRFFFLTFFLFYMVWVAQDGASCRSHLV